MGIEERYNAPQKIDLGFDREHHLLKMDLQKDLLKRKYPGIDIDKDTDREMEWILGNDRKYSKEFSNIFDQESTRNENFWVDIKNPEFREAFLKRIEEKLYAGEIVDNKKPDDDTMVLSS